MSVLRAEEQADYGSCRNRRTLGEMLHFILSILLGILKIIGILLLTVLVLLLLVLSAILCAGYPDLWNLAYEAERVAGSKKAEEKAKKIKQSIRKKSHGAGRKATRFG